MKRLALIVAGIFLATQFLGCATVESTHHITSARLNATEIPDVLGVNLTRDSGLSFRMTARYGTRDHWVTTTDTSRTLHATPDNYSVDWNSADAGLNFKYAPNNKFDLSFGYNANAASPLKNGVGILALGVTFPFPWLCLRISPAVSMTSYRLDVADSIHQVLTFGGDTISDTSFTRYSGDRHTAFVGTLGFTAWIPAELLRSPVIPYVGFQTNAWNLHTDALPSEEAIPDEAFYLTDYQFDFGLHYQAGANYYVNAVVSRNEKFNKADGAAYYRFAMGLEYRP